MNSLQKFNQILDDLNKEVEEFKDVSETYKKLEQLIHSYNTIIDQFKENNKILNKVNDFQKSQYEKVTKSLTEIENINNKNKNELKKLFEEKVDKIRSDNKEFYKDLESTVKIKLDDNKSEIKKLIENERIQIKQIFEIEFAKNTKELNQIIQIETKKIKFLLWLIGTLTLILSLLSAIKLWM